jgi:hypothetical protein
VKFLPTSICVEVENEKKKYIYISTSPYLSVYAEGGFTFGIRLRPWDQRVMQGRSVGVVTRQQGWTIDNGFPFSAGVRNTPVSCLSSVHSSSGSLPASYSYWYFPLHINWQRHEVGHSLHLLPRLVQHDGISPHSHYLHTPTTSTVPHTILWCFVKHRDNFKSIFLYHGAARQPPVCQDMAQQPPVCQDMAQQPPVCQSLLIVEDSWSHSDTPHSVELLWTSDQLIAETSTWQHTTFTTDRHPCPRRDSNPQSQQANGRRPTP